MMVLWRRRDGAGLARRSRRRSSGRSSRPHAAAHCLGNIQVSEPASSPGLSFRRTVLCLTLLTGIALAYYLALVHSVNVQRILTGEEASVSFLDVVFLEIRYQHNRFCTNIGGHVLFWIGSFLTPGHSLFWCRYWKAFEMAFLPPLVFLFFVHRLRLSWQASVFAGLCLVFLPGVTAYAWIGIEPGLDMIFGVLALYLVMSPQIGFVRSAHSPWGRDCSYTADASCMFLLFILRSLAEAGGRVRSLIVEVIVSGLIIAAILVLPFLWWRTGGVIIIGGGDLNFTDAWVRLRISSRNCSPSQIATTSSVARRLSSTGQRASSFSWRSSWA